ncbi:GW dipeptide domain-containing protein [Levilactobacillus tongjiangensis]|uniref:GW dipeptide domain-containing protein n=1 Tax=Levilactobacillus tongjiangensis TaxID=2486023 RepID=A0ABW1SU07_9LACO|nr:GW dipeptide domain-containing protein [Levilactobacillus tongjiangensis]
MDPRTKNLYFKKREMTHHGVKYIGLQRQSVDWAFTKGHARRKPSRTFYVRRSAVKKVKTVLAQTSIKKTPVNLKSSQYNFWTYPRGTRQSVKEQYRGSTYRFRTLYATEKMHTRLHGTFIKVQTASGKKLGWIYQGAVLSGRYLDPVAYLTRNTQLTKRVWVNKKKPRIKVASLSQDNQLKTLIVQAEDNSATAREPRLKKPAIRCTMILFIVTVMTASEIIG